MANGIEAALLRWKQSEGEHRPHRFKVAQRMMTANEQQNRMHDKHDSDRQITGGNKAKQAGELR